MTEPRLTPDTPEARLRALIEQCERLVIAWRDVDKRAKHGAWRVCADDLSAVLSSLASAPAEKEK